MSRGTGQALRALPLGLAIVALVMLALAGIAFRPQYLSRIEVADTYTHVHAAFGLTWLLVLIAQPLLIRARRFSAHRVLGRCAVILGGAFVVASFLATHRGINRMDDALFAREGYFVYMPLVLTALFAAALGLGVFWRSVPQVHARFMACTALAFADPLLARILGFYFPPLPADFLYQLPALIISCAVLFAFVRTLPRTLSGSGAFRAFAVGTVAALLIFFATPHSAAWLAFAGWFRALPIT